METAARLALTRPLFLNRLKCLLRLLEKGQVRPEIMQKNLKLAIQVLDSVYIDETSR